MSSSSASSAKIVAEYAKSSRSSCKKCSKTIAANALRLGLSVRDPRGFDNTRWHHLHCFPLNSSSIASVGSIKGFAQLKSADQETLTKMVNEMDQSPQKVSNGEKDAVIGRHEGTPKRQRSSDNEVTEMEERNTRNKKVTNATSKGELTISFSIADVKDMYKDATLLPKWKAFQTIIFLEHNDGLHGSSKIAAFDFDGCLAKTSVKRIGADAWSLMYSSIPEKLRSLYKEGYKLVIFTNESNIDRWKNKRQVAVDSKIGRLESFIDLVKVPVQVFIACGSNSGEQEDPFRKPKPGMWFIMKQHFNSGIPIDMDQSFYVGDAAGRPEDHSDADIKFAQTVGLKFFIPEDYFKV